MSGWGVAGVGTTTGSRVVGSEWRSAVTTIGGCGSTGGADGAGGVGGVRVAGRIGRLTAAVCSEARTAPMGSAENAITRAVASAMDRQLVASTDRSRTSPPNSVVTSACHRSVRSRCTATRTMTGRPPGFSARRPSMRPAISSTSVAYGQPAGAFHSSITLRNVLCAAATPEHTSAARVTTATLALRARLAAYTRGISRTVWTIA